MPDITISYFITRKIAGSVRETPIYTETLHEVSATAAILRLADRIITQNPGFRARNIHITSIKGDNHHGKTST